MKFAFVVPLKPKRNSRDWSLDSFYLRQTVTSMLHQTNNRFHIFVVLHDMPESALIHEQLTYVTFPLPYLAFSGIKDGQDQLQSNSYYKERDIEYQFDQGRKQMFGAHTAIQSDFDYIMCVDADDIICKELVDFVLTCHQPNEPGWFVDKGYFYLTESKRYIRQPYAMNMLNGSTYIIYKDFIPDFDITNEKLGACNFYSNHPGLEGYIKSSSNKFLRPLPFYASIVQITNMNWWKTTSKITGVTIRQKVKYFIRLVIIKKYIKKRFVFSSEPFQVAHQIQ